jgi:hypothetical protein
MSKNLPALLSPDGSQFHLHAYSVTFSFTELTSQWISFFNLYFFLHHLEGKNTSPEAYSSRARLPQDPTAPGTQWELCGHGRTCL